MRRLAPESLGRHLDALYRAAWALCGSREDAEDLVQETFARVLAKPRLVSGDERAYLMQALRNTFYSRLRANSRRPPALVDIDQIEPPADLRPSRQPDRALDVSELLAAIAQLPEDFRFALVAVDIVGLSYAEAGRVLDVPEATITTRVYRARQRLVRQFAEPPAAGPARREGSRTSRSLD